MAEIFTPSTYIQDRGFAKSKKEAEDSFTTKNRFTCWTYHDIESYLLYTDWLLEALDKFKAADANSKSFPKGEDAVDLDIVGITASFIHDHAGRATFEALNRKIGPTFHFSAKPSRSAVSGGGAASDRHHWEQLIKSEIVRLKKLKPKLDLNEDDVLEEYTAQIEKYDRAARDISTARLEFCGKRLFQALTDKWGVRSPKSTSRKSTSSKPGTLLRDVVVEVTSEYARNVKGVLSEDVRLSDFGKLASKITGQKI